MASDISLAVGDGARRMTYAELAAVRGTSQASAVRLVRRHRWPRQAGNDGVVRVTVPLPFVRKSEKSATSDNAGPREDMSGATPGQVSLSPGPSVPVVPGTDPGTIRALEGAIEALREQLAKADQREESEHRWRELANSSLVAERERAERSECRADELQVALTEERRRVEVERQLVEDGRKQIDELHTALADAVTAERIAAGEAAALRAIVTGLRARRWWRRWFR